LAGLYSIRHTYAMDVDVNTPVGGKGSGEICALKRVKTA
jgi:hypothetical protein